MTFLIISISVILLVVLALQIGKLTELTRAMKGEGAQDSVNKFHGTLSIIFLVVFLIGTFYSAFYYKNYMLGYGPHESASVHGSSLDFIFNVTLVVTGIVFVITQVLLFYYAFKYSGRRNRKALFHSHDNKLEIIWTAIPAVVMTLLVMGGLDAWNDVMADVNPDDEAIEIEATGMQFAWLLRYPGADGQLGSRDIKLTSGTNPIGQDWTDPKNHDDLHPSEIVLPVGKKVRVRILSRDVLHNFFLPHFRLKMDAVPGMPTYFVFTPSKTTEEYRAELSRYDEYNVPADPADPAGPKLWEVFNYELACAELCGTGHFSMRREVKIVSESEYNKWLSEQQSYYESSIKGTESDPLFMELIGKRKVEFKESFDKALKAETAEEKILRLDHVVFETGSAKLTANSKYELNNLIDILNDHPRVTIELAGHTDNTGDVQANQALSQSRAERVYEYLIDGDVNVNRLRAVGYGQSRPVESNDTPEGRQKNRRTEFQILTQ